MNPSYIPGVATADLEYIRSLERIVRLARKIKLGGAATYPIFGQARFISGGKKLKAEIARLDAYVKRNDLRGCRIK